MSLYILHFTYLTSRKPQNNYFYNFFNCNKTYSCILAPYRYDIEISKYYATLIGSYPWELPAIVRWHQMKVSNSSDTGARQYLQAIFSLFFYAIWQHLVCLETCLGHQSRSNTPTVKHYLGENLSSSSSLINKNPKSTHYSPCTLKRERLRVNQCIC